MGHYENGGSNIIGIATQGGWAAVWTVDTPYIDVYPRDFFTLHEEEIREAFIRGQSFSDSEGRSGAIHCINTTGDLDEKGWPKNHSSPSVYVLSELQYWIQEDGDAYAGK